MSDQANKGLVRSLEESLPALRFELEQLLKLLLQLSERQQALDEKLSYRLREHERYLESFYERIGLEQESVKEAVREQISQFQLVQAALAEAIRNRIAVTEPQESTSPPDEWAAARTGQLVHVTEASESSSTTDDVGGDETCYISPHAYVRSMIAIAVSSFRHPFSETTIDLTTGECVNQPPE